MAFLETIRAQFLTRISGAPLPDNISLIFLPVRPPSKTKIEYIPFESKMAMDELLKLRKDWTALVGT